MAQSHWTSPRGTDGGAGAMPRLVPAPVASPGIRNALRGAFSCDADTPEIFDRLLAQLR